MTSVQRKEKDYILAAGRYNLAAGIGDDGLPQQSTHAPLLVSYQIFSLHLHSYSWVL